MAAWQNGNALVLKTSDSQRWECGFKSYSGLQFLTNMSNQPLSGKRMPVCNPLWSRKPKSSKTLNLTPTPQYAIFSGAMFSRAINNIQQNAK